MERYIPKVTVIGGVIIGLLTLIANMMGTLGGAGGTGLLLAVSIVYRLYEQIASEQIQEMYPMMQKFFGAAHEREAGQVPGYTRPGGGLLSLFWDNGQRRSATLDRRSHECSLRLAPGYPALSMSSSLLLRP